MILPVTPVGPLSLSATWRGLSGVWFGEREGGGPAPVLKRAGQQIQEYLAGARREFDVPLDIPELGFSSDVWRALLEIPYGKTLTYGEMATRIGGSARAVGRACGANPLPLVVPCHRVLGKGGAITGYGGGIAVKRFLLALESGGLF